MGDMDILSRGMYAKARKGYAVEAVILLCKLPFIIVRFVRKRRMEHTPQNTEH